MLLSCEKITQFRQFMIENEKSAATVEKYVRDVERFARWLCDEKLTKIKMLEYKKTLTEKYAPASVNSAIASLNSFFDFLNQSQLKIKGLKIQRKIFENRDRELTRDEYLRLLKAAKKRKNQRIYYLMQTICSTGIRVSEVKFVTIEALRQKRVQISCKGKMRVVILPNKLCRMLVEFAKQEKIQKGSIFITKNGNPLDRSNIWNDMKSLCSDAQVDKSKVFPHNLRHLFARAYYSMEKDIVRLADILGHSSINTTRIYTIETGDVHRRQIEKLNLLRC